MTLKKTLRPPPFFPHLQLCVVFSFVARPMFRLAHGGLRAVRAVRGALRSMSTASSSSGDGSAQEPSKRLRQVNIAIDRRGLFKVGKNPCT